jgi:hypothetical protein
MRIARATLILLIGLALCSTALEKHGCCNLLQYIGFLSHLHDQTPHLGYIDLMEDARKGGSGEDE